MWLGPSAQYAQEAVERGSGYPRNYTVKLQHYLFKVWAVSLNARYTAVIIVVLNPERSEAILQFD